MTMAIEGPKSNSDWLVDCNQYVGRTERGLNVQFMWFYVEASADCFRLQCPGLRLQNKATLYRVGSLLLYLLFLSSYHYRPLS